MGDNKLPDLILEKENIIEAINNTAKLSNPVYCVCIPQKIAEDNTTGNIKPPLNMLQKNPRDTLYKYILHRKARQK